MSQKFIFTTGKNFQSENLTTLYNYNQRKHPQYKITLLYANKLEDDLDKMTMYSTQLRKDLAAIQQVTIGSQSISGFNCLPTRGIVGVVVFTQAKSVQGMNDLLCLPYAHGPYLHYVKEYAAVYFDASLSFAIPKGAVKFFHVAPEHWSKIIKHSKNNVALTLFLKDLQFRYPLEYSIFDHPKGPRALVMHQPWAYLSCIGVKPVENRSRPLFGNSPMLSTLHCRACLTSPVVVGECQHSMIRTVKRPVLSGVNKGFRGPC